MTSSDSLFKSRQPLSSILTVPDKIISVYSLEQHVWAGSNSPEARAHRLPELQTIREFRIDPVRFFLNDILRQMAAPWQPGSVGTVGQGYWIQAEWGSGKSHLSCFLAALALGNAEAWDLVKDKEDKTGRGKRESLYQFYDEGLKAKSALPGRGILVVARTLAGTGSGIVASEGKTLTSIVLDAVHDQLEKELGRNISLYDTELLADRFLETDLVRYRKDLEMFLHDPKYFAAEEFESAEEFVRDIQNNRSPEYKRSRGARLWKFYTEYLHVTPQIASDTRSLLKNMVDTVVDEGYSGVLLLLDEMSLFMKGRSAELRGQDEETLAVLSNQLTRAEHLPVWTVVTAQEKLKFETGEMNVIADDRLKMIPLLSGDHGRDNYYDIVLNRVREIKAPKLVAPYYAFYSEHFTSVQTMTQDEFTRFFPFQKQAVEVLRSITYEITTARSAIHFMHKALKDQMKHKDTTSLIRLWELFDEIGQYEEDTSSVTPALVSIRQTRDKDYHAYEACKEAIDAVTKGTLKVRRDTAMRVLQTLFLYYISRIRLNGLTADEVANAVMELPNADDTGTDETVERYQTILEELKKLLPQVQEGAQDGVTRYRFDPTVEVTVRPLDEFNTARTKAADSAHMQQQAWDALLRLDSWEVGTPSGKLSLGGSVRSLFADLKEGGRVRQEFSWRGREITGFAQMGNLVHAEQKAPLVLLDTNNTDLDVAFIVQMSVIDKKVLEDVLKVTSDPRVIVWAPGTLGPEEQDRVLDFAAYRSLVEQYGSLKTEAARIVLSWVTEQLRPQMATIANVVRSCYSRGVICSTDHATIAFDVAGELPGILAKVADQVLSSSYESAVMPFGSTVVFKKEDAPKVVNGIVRTGGIPRHAKPDQNVSAARNFGRGLSIWKDGGTQGDVLDVSGNRYVAAIRDWLLEKMPSAGDGVPVSAVYSQFMGLDRGQHWGLTRQIVQIYLLCLVRTGEVTVQLTGKSGLSVDQIDYTNIADTTFSKAVLDSMSYVQPVVKPEGWTTVAPFVGLLLSRDIGSSDDAAIRTFRSQLPHEMSDLHSKLTQLNERATALFASLGQIDPCADDLFRAVQLTATPLDVQDVFGALIGALNEGFGYGLAVDGAPPDESVGDFAKQMIHVRALESFVDDRDLLEAGHAYLSAEIPDAFREMRMNDLHSAQKQLRTLYGNIAPFVLDESQRHTKLIGHATPAAGEKGTVGWLITEYTARYRTMHDAVTSELEARRETIDGLRRGVELKVLLMLDGVTALYPVTGPEVLAKLDECGGRISTCPDTSASGVVASLRKEPAHVCGLTFANASERIRIAAGAEAEAIAAAHDALDAKVRLLLSGPVWTLLKQGEGDSFIRGLLDCPGEEAVSRYLVESVQESADVASRLNRCLKKMVVKPVRMADFKPTLETVQKDQLDQVVAEFKSYLEKQFPSTSDPSETAVLRIERS